jgi:hypothetical protein
MKFSTASTTVLAAAMMASNASAWAPISARTTSTTASTSTTTALNVKTDVPDEKRTEIFTPEIAHFASQADLTPMECVFMRSHGNMQIMFSAYHGKPVNVEVTLMEEQKDKPMFDLAVFDRIVEMTCEGKLYCTAKSVLSIQSEEILDLFTSKDIGFGQMFAELGLKPAYNLQDCGRREDGGLWRDYNLDCDGLFTCVIHEDFDKDFMNPNFRYIDHWDRQTKKTAGQLYEGYGPLTEEKLMKMFDDMDRDNSGDIDSFELIYGLNQAQVTMSPEDAKTLFDAADASGDGLISKDEWTKLVEGIMENK